MIGTTALHRGQVHVKSATIWGRPRCGRGACRALARGVSSRPLQRPGRTPTVAIRWLDLLAPLAEFEDVIPASRSTARRSSLRTGDPRAGLAPRPAPRPGIGVSHHALERGELVAALVARVTGLTSGSARFVDHTYPDETLFWFWPPEPPARTPGPRSHRGSPSGPCASLAAPLTPFEPHPDHGQDDACQNDYAYGPEEDPDHGSDHPNMTYSRIQITSMSSISGSVRASSAERVSRSAYAGRSLACDAAPGGPSDPGSASHRARRGRSHR